jgi:Mg-chelatase subunit ChlD
MSFANPAALGLLALAIPILLLHVLKPRREQHTVASTFLWRSVAQPVSAAKPWQRLRPSVLLLLQLLAVALLAVAVADPVRVTDAPLSAHTVFIVDASGSMAAQDGDPTRLDEAVERAIELRGDLPEGGIASIVVADGNPRVLLNGSPDPAAFARELRSIQPTAGTADWAEAFDEAVGLDNGDAEIGYHLLTDGVGLAGAPAERLVPEGARHEIVGDRATNRAITSLVVTPRGSELHASATVANTGGGAASDTLRFDVDGVTAAEVPVDLDRDEQTTVEVDLPAGDRVEAFLEGEDLLDVDDHVFATAIRRRALTVLLCTPGGSGNPFLEGAFAAGEGVTVEACDAANPGTGADLVVYDRVAVPDDVAAPFLAVASPGGVPVAGITTSGSVETPVLTTIDPTEPLVEGLDLSEVGIAVAQVVDPGASSVVLAAGDVPLLLRGSAGGVPFVALTFAVGDSNLPLQVAFPILVDRALTDLAAASLPPADLVVDDQLPVDATVGGSVTAPGGTSAEVVPGGPAPVATRPGFWTIEAEGRPERVVAVNPDVRESVLEPAQAIQTPTRIRRPGDVTARAETSLRAWLLWPLLAVVLAELLVARRRRGVTVRQWRLAAALRIGIAALLVGALLAPTYLRRADRVAVVFLLDGSASLGAAGRAEGEAFVREALDEMPDGAVAGVVTFGARAERELTVQPNPPFDRATARVDRDRTNLASALRVGSGLLPADARRRLVIVSDGRANDGDVAAELSRLADQGIVVEHHLVGRDAEADLAVAALDLPSRVREGEAFELEVTIDADVAGPVQLTVLRGTEVVDERVVDVPVGRTVVTIPQVAGSGAEGGSNNGLGRYQVRVSGPGDAVAENDVGYGAVQVEGTAAVLLAEGSTGEGATLAAALEASGLTVDVVDAQALPPLDVLAGYQATVLVDVDARSLTTTQVDTLAAATRDLGRGLVTIGGERSYGVGGYLASPLEELLPVISEITDPQRRQSVAEVLAIDSSGSMGECHCAEGQGQNQQLPGGVEKTDIARAAAQRAIEALSEIDEVGVLAFNTSHEWLIDLQQLPPEDVVREGLGAIRPGGGTNLSESLSTAAEALRQSQANLKHIILFTDGFTDPGVFDDLAEEAAALYAEEGITTSVIATGEGAADELEEIAQAGGGRFYPGRDLQEIPQLMMEEAVLASRDFITEGSFLPEVTSDAEVVEGLTASPPLLGYVATTTKPQAATLLRIGPDRDPLLATWQLGVGRSTAWTSDASARWSQQWASWDGYADFWGDVVRDTFPTDGGDTGVTARVRDGILEVTVERNGAFADGATASARVTGPDLQPIDVPLTRSGAGEFTGQVPVGDAGTYAVGAQVAAADGAAATAGTALATLSYAPEFEPGDPDEAALQRVADATGGRGAIESAQAFDEADLDAGRATVDLAPWFVLAACVLWPLAVALSRLNLRGAAISHGVAVARWRVRSWIPARPARTTDGTTPTRSAAPPRPERPVAPPPEPVAPPSTIGTLLDRKRGSKPEDRGGDG